MVHLEAEVRFGSALPKTPNVQKELIGAMTTALNRIMKRARQNLSGRFLKVSSGKGVASVRAKIVTAPHVVIGTVGTPLFYLRILHTGFPAQEMVTKKTGFAFFGAGGQLIRTKQIRHPGVTARPWLQAALEESHEELLKDFATAAANVAQDVANEVAGSG